MFSSNFYFKKDENYYLQLFLKECRFTEKIVIRHISDDVEHSSDDSRLYVFGRAILKMSFLRKQPWEFNFESLFFEGAILINNWVTCF